MSAHRFHPTILRAYDIRGIFEDTLTTGDAFAIATTTAAGPTGAELPVAAAGITVSAAPITFFPASGPSISLGTSSSSLPP